MEENRKAAAAESAQDIIERFQVVGEDVVELKDFLAFSRGAECGAAENDGSCGERIHYAVKEQMM